LPTRAGESQREAQSPRSRAHELGYSLTPSTTEPYLAWGPPKPHHYACMAGIDPPGLGTSPRCWALPPNRDSDPHAEVDLKAYRSHYGLSECTKANGCFKKVNQKGEEANYPKKRWNPGDLRCRSTWTWSRPCARNAIYCWRRRTTSEFSSLDAAENEAATLGATEISDSWGGEEWSGETAEDPSFNNPGIPARTAPSQPRHGRSRPHRK
jgi:hypothetical protein